MTDSNVSSNDDLSDSLMPLINSIRSAGRERTALFVDGHHLYVASRALGFEVDYRGLLETFRASTNLIRAHYYATVTDTEDYTPLRPLTDWLSYNGWSVYSRPAKEFTDTTGRRRLRSTIMVRMCCDLLESANWPGGLQQAVVMAGDGELRDPIEILQRRGCRVTVISVIRGASSLIADELRRQADEFIDLDAIAKGFTRSGSTPRS